MKSVAKNTLCAFYKYSGAMRTQEQFAAWSGHNFGVVLLFHRVTDEIPRDGLTVDTRFFRGVCAMLRRRFHVVALAEMCRLVREHHPLRPRTIAITFDDCYRDNLAAARVLAEHGLPACFFLPTRYVGTDHVFEWDKSLKRMPNLDWNDVDEIVRLGHEIGSHTVSHADLGSIGPAEARQELCESRHTLEQRLQRPVRWLAYPYGARGNFRPEYLSLVQEAGYEGCFSAYGGFLQPGMWGQILPREAVPYFRDLMHLELHLTGCLNWLYGIKRKVGLIA
jgi:peptidoglycan/xylan/chitin deacetylase (PgdA/CDA1 family)